MTRERATSAFSERRYRSVVALLTAAVAAFGFVWALVLPPFSGPDELRHYNSAVRILDGGGWPLPSDAPLILDSVLTAYYESGNDYLDQRLVDTPDPADRSGVLEGRGWERTAGDQMVQHPPGYYAVMAAGIWLAGAESVRWDHAQLLMRIGSGLLVAASVPFLAGVARRVAGGRLTGGVIGAAAVLFVPFFANTGGHIGNDSMLIAACSAATYFAVRGLDARRVGVWLALAGVALGVALFTKGFALMLIPVVAVLSVMAVRRRPLSWPRKAGLVLLPLAVAFVLGGWWWARNLIVVGTLQPSILGGRTGSDSPYPGYALSTFIANAVTRLNSTFWGRGARPEYALPEAAVAVAGAVLILVFVVAFIVSPRRGVLLTLVSFPALILVTIISNAHGIYWDLGDPSRGLQGRYVFSGMAAVTTAIATVVVAWMGGRSARAVKGWTVVVIGAASLVSASSVAWVAAAVYPGVEAVSGIDDRHGVPSSLFVLAAGIAVFAIAAAGSLVLIPSRASRRNESLGKVALP